MNSARITTPGASSALARTFSLSSRRVTRETRSRLPVTTVASFKRALAGGVDLAQLARRPFHRFLGLGAAAGACIHDGDDELVPGFGGALVRLALVAHQALLQQRRGAERRHHRVLLPHRVV